MKAYREEVRKWRLTTPLDHFTGVGKKFEAAGIKIQAYNLSFNDSFTDEEIDRGFADGQGARRRLHHRVGDGDDGQARGAVRRQAHRSMVAMHNHSNLKDPNEFATPESFATAMSYSKFIRINLDIGHFTAANFDPIAYIEQHHEHITNLHLKDRKKDQGDNMPWGEGDTPIRQVLQLLRTKKYDIPANIEDQYRGDRHGRRSAQVLRVLQDGADVAGPAERARRNEGRVQGKEWTFRLRKSSQFHSVLPFTPRQLPVLVTRHS